MSAWALAVASYALVLAAGPLLHHDLVCHFTSRTHCTSCVAGVSAPGVTAERPKLAADPTTGIDLPPFQPPCRAALAVGALHGRAPPA